MSSSKLVTYDAICAAIKGRQMGWAFRSTQLILGQPSGNLTWQEVNTYRDTGALVLTTPGEGNNDLIEVYRVDWDFYTDQFTLERIF